MKGKKPSAEMRTVFCYGKEGRKEAVQVTPKIGMCRRLRKVFLQVTPENVDKPAFVLRVFGTLLHRRCPMVLVILQVNGLTMFKECASIEEAHAQADVWLAKAKKSYPNKLFKPKYFQAEEL